MVGISNWSDVVYENTGYEAEKRGNFEIHAIERQNEYLQPDAIYLLVWIIVWKKHATKVI